MQWRKPQNRKLVLEALRKAGREDLIGYGKHCLVRPDKGASPADQRKKPRELKKERPSRPVKKAGWAKAKPKKKK